MPKLQRPILESDHMVVRPVAIAVIQEIMMDRMAIPIDTKINYPGYTETVAQPHGFISNKYEPNRFPTSDKMFVEVTESYVNDWQPANFTNKPEHIPIFLNRDLELEMRPIYASMEMRISLKYRAKDKTEARRWYDYAMLKLPNREDTWLHDLKYSFSVPDVYMAILQEIHRLTELQAGYGDDFDTFFKKWVSPRYGILTDQAGKNQLGAFSETQTQCMGFFDFSNEPDFGARKDDTDVWEVEIPYVLRYEKPRDVYFSYPIVIHNTVLSSKYRGKTGMQQRGDVQTSRTWSMAHLKSFEAMENVGHPYRNFPGRYFPLFDEFMPRMVPPNTMRVFTTLVTIDPNDPPDQPNKLMNLLDLEGPQYGFKLSDCIKAFMLEEREWITTSRGSALNLALYMGRLCMDGTWLRMDENYDIWSTRPLNRRKYYHIRFSVCTDLTFLVQSAKDRLRKYPCALEDILEYILPEGSTIPPYKVIYGEVTPPSFDQVAEQLKGRVINGGMKTVQQTTVNAVYQVKKGS